MSLELPYGIKVLDNTPLDSLYGPYADVAAAKAAIPQAIRYDGLTVQITGTGEYHWLAADLSDTGLVAKGGGSSNTFSNGLTESGGAVKWGGTSTENTSINLDGFDFDLNSGGAFTFTGSSFSFSGVGGLGHNALFNSSNALITNDGPITLNAGGTATLSSGNLGFTLNKIDGTYIYGGVLITDGGDISNTNNTSHFKYNPSLLASEDNGTFNAGVWYPTITASQNGQRLQGLKISPSFNDDVFTGVTHYALQVDGDTEFNGSIGSTGNRITKGWFTDLQVTNPIAGSITGNAATVTTNANLTGHITSTGNAAVLGSFTLAQLNTAVSDANMASLAGSETLTNKTIDFTDNTIVMSKAELTAAVSDDDVLFAGDVGAGLTISSGTLIANNTIYDPTITANAYTLIASDNKKILHIDNGATAVTVNLPNSLLTGFSCTIVNKGTGILTLAAAGTLEADATTIQTQNTGATVYHEGSNVWTAVGSLGTPLVQEKTIAFVVGEATAITTGGKNFTRVISPYTGTIKRWYLIADQSTTTTVDIWKSAGAIPTNTNTITASAKPALSAAELGNSSTLTGWTTAVTAGDVLIMEVESNNNATYLNLQLVIEL